MERFDVKGYVVAVVSVTRKHNGSRATRTVDSLEITDVWIVQTNDSFDGINIVETAPGVPRIRSRYYYPNGTAANAYCGSTSITHVDKQDAGDVWYVEGQFSSQVDPQQNPLQQSSIIRYGFAKYQKAIEVDRKGKKIANSAGQPFLGGLQIDDSRPVFTVERNEETFPYKLAVEYQDAINSDTWWGMDPETVKVQNITGDPVTGDDGVTYYAVRYELELRRDGWKAKVLDKGFVDKDGKAIKVGAGQMTPTEALFDGDGKKLALDQDAVPLEFDVYEKLPFKRLRLP